MPGPHPHHHGLPGHSGHPPAHAGARRSHVQEAQARLHATHGAQSLAALQKEVADLKATLAALRGAGGIQVNLPVISYTGKPGAANGGLELIVVVDGITQPALFPGAALA